MKNSKASVVRALTDPQSDLLGWRYRRIGLHWRSWTGSCPSTILAGRVQLAERVDTYMDLEPSQMHVAPGVGFSISQLSRRGAGVKHQGQLWEVEEVPMGHPDHHPLHQGILA